MPTAALRRVCQRAASLAVAALLSACAATAPKPFVADRLTPELRQAAFREVGALLSQRYVDPRLNGVDWPATEQRWRERVLQAPDDEAFWRELNRMVGELKDAHSRVLSPMDLNATREQRGSHGLLLEQHDGRWLLARVSGGSQAALLGVRAGQTVLQVDGEPVQAWWQRQLAEVRGSSTERAQRLLVNGALNAGAVGSQRRLQLQRADGSIHEVTLRQDALQHPEVRSHLLADGTGYLRFNGFQPALVGELELALKRLAPAQRLVLDLRGNPGGAHRVTMQTLGWLLPPGSAGRVVTRDNQRLTAMLGLLDVTPNLDIPNQPQRLQQPLAVLIDDNSASGAELMAGVLQSRGRARLFGSTSCGCLLGVRGGEALSGGGRLVFSEVDMLIDGRQRIEGLGITPDDAVWADPDAALLGDDAVLAAARAWLAAQPPGKPGSGG